MKVWWNGLIIYKITNNIDGRVYIGQTQQTLEKRIYGHIHSRQSKIGKAIREIGIENFTIEEIDHADTKVALNELERFWIAWFDSRHNGYNTLIGGEVTKEEMKLLNTIANSKPKKRKKKKETEERKVINILEKKKEREAKRIKRFSSEPEWVHWARSHWAGYV